MIELKLGSTGLALALLAACGGGSDDSTPAAGSDAESAAMSSTDGYTVETVTDGGSIRGSVTFVGPVPAPNTVSVGDDSDACGDTQLVQSVQTLASGGLANAVVSVVDITRGADASSALAQPPTLDQHNCRFVPHVLLAPAGTDVHVLNNDPLTHNVHTAAFDNRPVNRAQPRTLPQIDISFDVAEKVTVRCDIHGWMNAWIVVIDHPYHAITIDDGSFVIPNVPPGDYTLDIWHETLGSVTQTVTVSANQTTAITVEMAQQN